MNDDRRARLKHIYQALTDLTLSYEAIASEERAEGAAAIRAGASLDRLWPAAELTSLAAAGATAAQLAIDILEEP